jgi:lipoprotein-releasing system permease protein
MAVEYFIGGRYLRTKQKQAFISLITFLSVAGVTVGVMALIVVIAVMAGFESDLKSRILNVDAHITLQSYEDSFPGYGGIIETLEGLPKVENATPFISTQVMLRSSGGYSPAYVRGVDLLSVGQVIKYLDTGSLMIHDEKRSSDSSLKPGLVLGKELAGYLGVFVGDSVQIISSPRGSLSPIGHIPAMRQFEVVGLFESGMYEYDRTLGFMSLASAQSLQRMGDEVNGIEIRILDIYHAADIRQVIVETLGFPFRASDWIQKNQNLFSALKLERTVMFIILTLIVLVAAFNIASTLIMMVMEKKKDIAILRTMGATDRQVRRIFVFKGMVIGLIGTILGDALGLILCSLLKRYEFIQLPSDVYYLSKLPVELQPLVVINISMAALAICFLATLYPAIQASRMNPVEAIRNA